MIDDGLDPDDKFAVLLAEIDTRLAHQGTSLFEDEPLPQADAFAGRLSQATQCLAKLEQLWPRARNTPEPVPDKIDRFQILKEVGRGGFGIVYLAHDKSLGRNVALKVQRP